MDQLLRKAAVASTAEVGLVSHDRTPDISPPTPTRQTAGEYRRYALEVPNRSLVDPDARRSMANLLQAVLDAVDPDTGGDLQLIDVHVNVTADPIAVLAVADRANAAGAKWREEELDF
jgi:hypothetical protein